MAGYDRRRETWLFQRTNLKSGSGKPGLVRLPMNFVEYGADPDRYLEPVNLSERFSTTDSGDSTYYMVPVGATDDAGVMVGIEVFDAPPFAEVQEFHSI